MKLRFKLQSIVNKIFFRKGRRVSKGHKFSVSKKKKKQRISWKPIAIIGIALLLILFLTMYLVPTVKSLSRFSLQRDETDGGGEVESWNGNERLIILTIGLDAIGGEHKFVDGLVLYVIEPDTGRLGVFGINPDYDVNVAGINKSLNIRTLYNLEEADGREVEIITKAVENLLAVSIDRYVIVDEDQFNNAVQFIGPVQVELGSDLYDKDVASKIVREPKWTEGENWLYADEYLAFLASDELGRNNQLNRSVELFAKLVKGFDSYEILIKLPQILDVISENVRTNLSEWELVNVVRTLSGIRSDQIRRGYTRTESAIKRDLTGIYSRLQPVSEAIDNDLESILYDFNIAKEQAGIEILNGSGVPGMASTRSRWVRNSGGRVVHFGNSVENYDVTTVYVSEPEKYPATLREIERIFDNKVKYADVEYKYRHIGDIIIVIGKDIQSLTPTN